MSFTSDDVNLLVYRYLQESGECRICNGSSAFSSFLSTTSQKGFTHTAFTFRNESKLSEELLAAEKPRRGVLINFIQKGLVYTEIETHIKPDGGEVNCRQPFSITQQHVCKVEKGPGNAAATPGGAPAGAGVAGAGAGASVTSAGASGAPAASDGTVEVLDAEVAKLQSHTGEVFACQWNPKMPNLLATGASDATAVLWTLPAGRCGPVMGKKASESRKVLPHAPAASPSRDVTTLEWSPDGSLLATGSYDGTARLWTTSGGSAGTLTGHAGPIFSLRWTTDSRFILSGGVDKTARIWEAKTGREVKRFNVHQAPTLDVAWRDNTSFATCSSDKTVTYCRWDQPDPIQRWAEHTDEVNAVVWDPTSRFVASCSDDKSIKVWTPSQARASATLLGHEREIYTVRWRPAGSGNAERLLSASFDGTARLWEVETAKCVKKFPRRKQPVYAIEFSPDGQYCVIGSFDRTVEVFHVDSGKCVQNFLGPAGVFDVDWNTAQGGGNGDKIAVATAKGCVSVMDIRMPKALQ